MIHSFSFARRQVQGFLLCSLGFASACHAVGVPNLKISELVAASDVIAITQVYAVKERGAAAPIPFRGQLLDAEAYIADLNVLSVIKGSVSGHISVKYSLPDTFIGYQGLREGTRIVFLKGRGNEFGLADPYHPDLPATRGARLAYGSEGHSEAVEQEMLAVIASPSTTAGQKSEILRFDYALPSGSSAIDSLKSGLTSVVDEDLRQRIEGELVRLGDTSELPNIVLLLLNNSATSNQRVWLLYVIANYVTDPLAIPALQPLLGSTDDPIREAAGQALWHIGSPAAVQSLAKALEDPDQSVRFYAVRGCADIAKEFGWGGPSESEFQEHEQRYLAHWRAWTKTQQRQK
jgi:HEAT repeat protein